MAVCLLRIGQAAMFINRIINFEIGKIVYEFICQSVKGHLMKKAKIHMIGNTHIDPVWLWKKAEGMQKVKFSFSSALERWNGSGKKYRKQKSPMLKWISC